MYVHIYVKHIYICNCTYLSVLMCMYDLYMYIHLIKTRRFASQVEVRIYMYTYILTYVSVYMYIHVYIFTHMYIYTYVHICIHVYLWYCRYHIVTGEDITEQRKIIDSMLQKLKEKQALDTAQLSWGDVFNHSFEHTKSVYIETYLADCIIWPPLQFINFTFVPLRYQSLYVNICNLGWNTFLSIMANKSH
jgi:hypothetical protein